MLLADGAQDDGAGAGGAGDEVVEGLAGLVGVDPFDGVDEHDGARLRGAQGGDGVVDRREVDVADAAADPARALGEEGACDAGLSSGGLESAGQRERRAGAGPDGTDETDDVARNEPQVDGRDHVLDLESVGEDHRVIARPVTQRHLPGQDLALNVERRQQLVEPTRQPPGTLAEQRHDGGNQRHPHQERVDGDADREG